MPTRGAARPSVPSGVPIRDGAVRGLACVGDGLSWWSERASPGSRARSSSRRRVSRSASSTGPAPSAAGWRASGSRAARRPRGRLLHRPRPRVRAGRRPVAVGGPGPAVDVGAGRVRGSGERSRAPGPVRWAASGGLRSLVAALAEGLPVALRRPVERVDPGPTVDGETADAVVLAMPDPQARRLLPDGSAAAARLEGREWRPVIAVAAGWARREWPPMTAAFVNDHPVLSLVADDGDRRGDGAPVLVAHSVADVARRYDASPDDAVVPMLDALRRSAGPAVRSALDRTRTAGGSPRPRRTGTTPSTWATTASGWPATAGAARGSRRPGGRVPISPAQWSNGQDNSDERGNTSPDECEFNRDTTETLSDRFPGGPRWRRCSSCVGRERCASFSSP